MPHRPVPALAVAILLTACASPAEQAADHGARAAALFEAGQLREARQAARDVLQVAPKNVQARYVLARMAEQDGQIGQMLGHLEVVIGEDPAHVPARLTLATMLVHAQDYDGARLLLDQLKTLAPDDPDVRLLEARLLVRTGAVDAGIDALDFIIDRQPDHGEAALLRGLAYASIDPDLGLADLADSIQRLGKADTTALRQARIGILHREQRTANLESELKALVQDHPAGGHGRDLAAFYLAEGRLDDAEQSLAAAVAAAPRNVELQLALAALQARRRQEPALAEQALKALMAEAPSDPALPLLLGQWYEGSGRLDEARARYAAVLRQDARSDAGCEARVRIAGLDLATGRRAEARAALDGVLADCPDQVQALVARGRMNGAEGRLDDAVADLRGALRKAPGDHAALLAMARVHMDRADWTLARDAHRRLLEASPWPADLVNLAGQDRGSWDEAIARLGAELAAARNLSRNDDGNGNRNGTRDFTGRIQGPGALFQKVSGS